MRDAMAFQRLEVLGAQEVFVPHLHPIRPALRHACQELVQVPDEVPAMPVIARIKLRELENEHADVLLERFKRLRKGRPKQIRIQKVFVWLSGSLAIARLVGKFLDCDLIGDLKREQEIRRHLCNQFFDVPVIREPVIPGVHANRLERLGVFRQAIPFKPRFRELPAGDVFALVINHPTPARTAAADLINQVMLKQLIRKLFLYVNNWLEGNALLTIMAMLEAADFPSAII